MSATNCADEGADARLKWRVAGTSVIGTSHIKSGLVCQDNRGWFTAGKTIVVAVADGAGSAPLSQIGSAVAVRAAIGNLLEQYHAGLLSHKEQFFYKWMRYCRFFSKRNCDEDENLRKQLIRSLAVAAKAVEKEAQAMAATPQDLATTLIILVASSEFVAVAQVGDGAVVVKDQDSNIVALTAPSNGEFLNETVFLTSPSAPQHMQIAIRPLKPKNLAIFSDGLQRLALKMPSAEPHAPFFAPLFQYISSTSEEEAARGIEDFLKSERIGKRTDDDLTLVLAHFG